jgi:hypothetical protein
MAGGQRSRYGSRGLSRVMAPREPLREPPAAATLEEFE